MLSRELITRWEAAYRRYVQALDWADEAARNPNAAHALASASWEVASVWREIAKLGGQAWWILAAVTAAADAFEHQARQWRTHTIPHQGGTGHGPRVGTPGDDRG